MNLPTKTEIAAELLKLKEQRNTVRKFSAFGDNNQAKIDAQINVIENGWDEDDIDQMISNEAHEDAMEARYWLDGQSLDGKPSESWESLCTK
jgi:hypothetical protein